MKFGRFTTLYRVAVGFALMLALLVFERMGIQYGETQPDLSILSYDQVMRVKETKREKMLLIMFGTII